MIDGRLTEEESRRLAKQIVQELVVMLSHEESVGNIAKVWGKYIDQWIGKNMRRAVVAAFLFLSGVIAVRSQVWEWFMHK